MIFDKLVNSNATDFEKTQIISKGINDYRRKILDTFFPEGVPYREVPFFMAALNLTLKDMRNFARRNNDLENCMGAAEEAEKITDLFTETVSFTRQEGKKNG